MAKDEASSHHEAISPLQARPAQAVTLVQLAPPIQLQVDVVSQLLPTLTEIQQALQQLTSNQENKLLLHF